MNKTYSENELKMMKILKDLGIEMSADACSCCDGAWVTFKYKGETIIDAVGDSGFNTEDLKSD